MRRRRHGHGDGMLGRTAACASFASVCVLLAVSPLAAQQDAPAAAIARWCTIVADAARSTDERLDALVALQDRGALPPALVAQAMGDADDDVARAAAAIVRHEWRELPSALFAGLDASPRAARVFLRELAQAPRPAAVAWAAARCGPEVARDDRLLALVASGGALQGEAADLVLQALLDGDLTDGARAAQAMLPARSADRLLGKLHAALQSSSVDVLRVPPLLDRLSASGLRQLLGLIVSLPDDRALALCDHLQLRAPQLLGERVAAALDDPTPLSTCWLPHAGPHLGVPSRRERLEALLADANEAMPRREHAFTGLLAARLATPAMLDFASDVDTVRSERQLRVRRLLDAAVEAIPPDVLLRWLDTDEQQALRVVQALSRRRGLEPELGQRLARDLLAATTADGQYLAAAAYALVQRGDEASLRASWPVLRRSARFEDLADGLARRQEAFAGSLLRDELAALAAPADAAAAPHVAAASGPEDVATRERHRAAVLLALATHGDADAVQQLVAGAATSAPGFVRRCAHHVPVLPAAAARALLATAGVHADGVAGSPLDAELRVELVAWAAGAVADAEVAAAMVALWRQPAREPQDGDRGSEDRGGDRNDEQNAGRSSGRDAELVAELRDVALRALTAGPRRRELVAELRAAIAAGPLSEHLLPLPYEALGSMPTPLAADDLRLCAELLLWPACTDPARDAEGAARFPDGTGGFPLVVAIAQRLRGASPDAVDAAFATVLADLAADPRLASLVPQRLLVFWRTLTIEPALLQRLGERLAPLLRSDDRALRGPADRYLGDARLRRGEPAVDAMRAAIAGLLRLPSQRAHARVFLGERDPGAGVDPWAALSAQPYVAMAHAAVAARDAAALRSALHGIREFAGHDAGTLATLDTFPTPESLR